MAATPACAESVEKALGGAASEVTRESCIAVLKETMGTIEPYLSTALVPTEPTEGEGAPTKPTEGEGAPTEPTEGEGA